MYYKARQRNNSTQPDLRLFKVAHEDFSQNFRLNCSVAVQQRRLKMT